ncbi:MAG: NAD(P)/FAD-dependent oxidoreductase [Acidimicrobiales bacterium]|nr:NAD(P)/FAD-dependent oxidoreductase [Acidimicrobiales bacterium]MCB9371474.1 NAD(P)/FAD-dependent oxidoreductase [Microthrixaceae bacterium]
MAEPNPSVVIVGGGFAGVGCAKALAEHDVDVTLIDRNNFHQFQPLLYQVATAQASPADVATPLRDLFRKHPRVTVKKATVTHVDPATRTVSTAEGAEFSGDYLVLAAGTGPNFFGVPGADEHALPLYALRDATRLRDRVFELFEEADTTPEVIEQGALTFVIVGGGPTGVETAGALIDLVDDVLAARFHDLDVATAARVVVVDHGEALLRPFSESAHEYVARVLEDRGVELWLGRGVAAVHADRVELADGTSIPTRCVVWAGGVSPTPLGLADELTTGRGPRLATAADLTLVGHPRVYAIGDVAQIADHDGTVLPQLGSVALQAGTHAGHNIRRHAAGRDTEPFRYHDKGIMAMIGRNAAIAELGAHRHELHGHLAFTAWLGVHALLMSGTRERVDLFVSWAWDYFTKNRAPSIVESTDGIDWDDAGS